MNAPKTHSSVRKKALQTYGNLITSMGFPPTVREFCEAMGYKSSSTGHEMLKNLRNDGYPCCVRGCEDIALMKATVQYWLNFTPCGEPDRFSKLETENRELKVRLAETEDRLAAVKAWVSRADQIHGVERAHPHEWVTYVRGRLKLRKALGEIAP